MRIFHCHYTQETRIIFPKSRTFRFAKLANRWRHHTYHPPFWNKSLRHLLQRTPLIFRKPKLSIVLTSPTEYTGYQIWICGATICREFTSFTLPLNKIYWKHASLRVNSLWNTLHLEPPNKFPKKKSPFRKKVPNFKIKTNGLYACLWSDTCERVSITVWSYHRDKEWHIPSVQCRKVWIALGISSWIPWCL